MRDPDCRPPDCKAFSPASGNSAPGSRAKIIRRRYLLWLSDLRSGMVASMLACCTSLPSSSLTPSLHASRSDPEELTTPRLDEDLPPNSHALEWYGVGMWPRPLVLCLMIKSPVNVNDSASFAPSLYVKLRHLCSRVASASTVPARPSRRGAPWSRPPSQACPRTAYERARRPRRPNR